MSDQIKATPRSWHNAAESFDDAAVNATGALSDLLATTTNAAACRASEGLATIDGAVAIMLTAFGSVMQESVLTPLGEGLADEAMAMNATGIAFQEMEDHAESVAKEAWH